MIYFVRHGQSQSNAGGASLPNAEIPLTALGQQQARASADWLAQQGRIDAIIVSRFLRTQQTAQPLCERLSLPYRIVEDIQEFDYIAFEHIAEMSSPERRTLAHHFLQHADFDQRDGKDTESIAEFVQRVRRAWQVLQHWQADERVYVVYTHGYWLGMLHWLVQGNPLNNKQDFYRFQAFELPQRPMNTEIRIIEQQQLRTVYRPDAVQAA